MKKNEIIKTPYGPAQVLRFTMLIGFRSGVMLKVIETGQILNEGRFKVDNWQREVTANEQS